jgi:Glyoxalase-like domain
VNAAAQRLVELGATLTAELAEDGLDHYGVGMLDPEGNEFDIN